MPILKDETLMRIWKMDVRRISNLCNSMRIQIHDRLSIIFFFAKTI
jgi:hypothetical protein